MNDRYLFRAKRIDNGELIEGFLIFEKDRAFIAHRVCEVMNSYSKTGEEYGFGNFIEVYPSTICQCTGLKDKNGKLIWENDIVSGRFAENRIVGYIKYGSNAKFYIERNGMYGIYLDNSQDWLEVMGNIFDEGSENIGK